MPDIAVIVPAYNEAPNLPELYRRLQTALEPLDVTWELVVVDDGSTDESLSVIRDLRETHGNVQAIVLARSFGQNNAIAAGIDFVDAHAVVVMDADLQDPPEVIPEMVARWRDGARVVAGRRTRRHSTPLIKRALAYTYYRIMRRLVDWEIPADTAEFRLMDRTVVEALRDIPQRHRLTRTLVAWLGFEQVIVDYEHAPRHAGQPKYSLRKSIRLAVTSITSFSLAPIRAAAVFGMFAAVLGFVAMAWWVWQYIQDESVSSTALIAGSIWFIGGVQCFFVAVIGEYVARTYMETQHRPLYVVRERID